MPDQTTPRPASLDALLDHVAAALPPATTLRDEIGEALVAAGGMRDTFPVIVTAQAGVLADAVLARLAELPTAGVLAEVAAERIRQNEKWGPQNHPDGTGGQRWRDAANYVTSEVDDDARLGRTTWNGIAREELFEALAESDPTKLRAELVQLAAVAVCWIEAIDRRTAANPN